jgi:hypothetical protein
MKRTAIEYPHPVLNEYTNDFNDCNFSIEIVSHDDNGSSLNLEIQYSLNCQGISELLKKGVAKAIVRTICPITSYREIGDLNTDGSTIISIPKKYVMDIIEIQGFIVAKKDYSGYFLDEFNKEYFGTTLFNIRKGDILANEPGIAIKLDTLLEKNTSGIVLVTGSSSISEMTVKYAKADESDPAFANYIVIVLPENEYRTYGKLMTKKYMKTGVERFLQASVILPAITEGISILRNEELYEREEGEPEYSGTVWANSIKDALRKLGIEDLSSCMQTNYELANKILGNVCGDSLNNLMQKITDWSTIRQEDEVL